MHFCVAFGRFATSSGDDGEILLCSGALYSDDPQPTLQAVGPFCNPLGVGAERPVSGDPVWSFSYPSASKGERVYGYCQCMPSHTPAGQLSEQGAGPPRPGAVICITSHLPFFQVYFRALEILAHLLSSSSLLCGDIPEDLPPDSDAARFLSDLHTMLQAQPGPGTIVRLPLPPRSDYSLSQLPTIVTEDFPPVATASGAGKRTEVEPMQWGPDFTEVQIPPKMTAAEAAVGGPVVPLATLVYVLQPTILATLVASLLLERSVILVSDSFLSVALGVYAAAELTYPMRWHHIFFPLMPSALLDLLASPAPFLVGLPSQLLGTVTWKSLGRVVVVNLDDDTICPAVTDEDSDSHLLPGWMELVHAFGSVKSRLRSSNEFRHNATVSAIVQEFLAATIGSYREFIRSPSQPQPQSMSQRISSSLRSRLAAQGVALAAEPDADAKAEQESIIGGDNGFKFFHSAFVSSFVTKVGRDFAAELLHTQSWQVFVRERMALLQQPYISNDTFEVRVLNRQARNRGLSAKLSSTLERVKESKSTAAFREWTGKNTKAMMAFGKQAAASMRSALVKLENKVAERLDTGKEDLKDIDDDYNEPQGFFDNLVEAISRELQPTVHESDTGPPSRINPAARDAERCDYDDDDAAPATMPSIDEEPPYVSDRPPAAVEGPGGTAAQRSGHAADAAGGGAIDGAALAELQGMQISEAEATGGERRPPAVQGGGGGVVAAPSDAVNGEVS